jgi:hypothetical protein
MQQSQDAGNTNPLVILRNAHRLLRQQGEAAAKAICLDVYECVSESAVPLPARFSPARTTPAGASLPPASTGNSRGCSGKYVTGNLRELRTTGPDQEISRGE